MVVRISKNRVALENIPLNEALGANIASAATVNLTNTTGNTVHLTGTTTITAITLASGSERTVVFDGILTLTHHSTNNNLPGGVNITTALNDRARYIADGTTVYCVNYQKADGTAVVGITAATQAEMEAGSITTAMVTPGRQQYHPSAAKVWGYVNRSSGAPSLSSPSYGVSSLVDEAVAQTRVNLNTAFSSTVYAPVAAACNTTQASYAAVGLDGLAAGSFAVKIWGDDGSARDTTDFTFSVFGDI